MRKGLAPLLLLLVMASAACRRGHVPVTQPAPDPQTPQPSAVIPAPATSGPAPAPQPLSGTQRILAALSDWDPAPDEDWAPTWIGIDDQNRLVLGGAEDKRQLLQEPARFVRQTGSP